LSVISSCVARELLLFETTDRPVPFNVLFATLIPARSTSPELLTESPEVTVFDITQTFRIRVTWGAATEMETAVAGLQFCTVTSLRKGAAEVAPTTPLLPVSVAYSTRQCSRIEPPV